MIGSSVGSDEADARRSYLLLAHHHDCLVRYCSPLSQAQNSCRTQGCSKLGPLLQLHVTGDVWTLFT